MAGGARKITVEFLGADKSLSSTARQAEAETSRLGARMKTVGKIAAVGLAAGAVFAGKALFEMGKNAMNDEAAARRLAIALKNTTGATKAQVASVEDWISKQGVALGVTDDELRPALNKLVTATHDVGKAQKLASLAMDISAGTGKDLSTVSMALAKAQNGNVASLGRLGLKVKDATGHTKSLRDVTRDLAKTYSGQASAAANSTQGKFARLKLILDETQEAIGYKLIPIAEKLATWFLNSGLPAIQKFSAYLRDTMGPVFERVRDIISKTVGEWAAVFRKNLPAIIATVQSFVSIVQSLWSRFGATITSYVTSTWANIKTVIGGALNVIAGIFKTFSALLRGDWSGVWAGIKQTVSGAWQVIKGVVSQGVNVVRSVFSAGMNAIKGVAGSVWNGITNTISNGASKVVNAVSAIPGKIKALGASFFNAGKNVISRLLNGLLSVGGSVAEFGKSLVNAVIGFINKHIIGSINSALDFTVMVNRLPVHIDPPDIPGIPTLAKGGVVRARPGGTLALIGEAGHDEAVVPLSGPNAPKMSNADFSVTAPLVIQMDSTSVWQGLVKMKRTNGIVSLGLD